MHLAAKSGSAKIFKRLIDAGADASIKDNAGYVATAPAAQSKPTTSFASANANASSTSYNMIEGNTGLYLSPITSDGVAAPWVDKSINAQMGSQIGGAVGAYAGAKALESVPFVGSFIGNKAGASIGKSVALKAVGGEEYIRQTSDISFNNLNDMARWLMANYSSHQKLQEILKATYQIYPDLQAAISRVR